MKIFLFGVVLSTGNPIKKAESDYDDLHMMPESMGIQSVTVTYHGL